MGYTDTVRILEECRTQTLSEYWKDEGHRHHIHRQNIGSMQHTDKGRILEGWRKITILEYLQDGGQRHR